MNWLKFTVYRWMPNGDQFLDRIAQPNAPYGTIAIATMAEDL